MSDSDSGWSWDDEQAAQQAQLAADLAARTTAPTQEIAQAAANAAIGYTPPIEEVAPTAYQLQDQAAPWSPPQEQAPAAPATPATVAPLTAAQQYAIDNAWIPTVVGGGGDSGASTPVLFNTITGETKSADPVMGAANAPILNYDISGLTSHTKPNFEGTPTEFGNDQGTQAILTRLGIQPISNYNLVLNPGEKPSSTTAIQGTDSQNQLLFKDENGQPTTVNTGTPYISGTLADKIMMFKPAKDVGVFDPNFVNALEMAAVMALSAGAGGALLGGVGAADAAAATTALTDAGLSTSQIASLGAEYGTGSAAAAGAAASTSGLPTLVTEAAKSAALNAGMTAIKGGSPADIIKSGLVGAVSGGAGSAIGDAGLGSLGTTIAKGATQAGLTALTGGNVANSLLSSAAGAVLPIALDSALPEGMLDSLPKPIVDTITNATAKAVVAAATNGDVSSAALNSIIGSAAGAATSYATDAVGLKGLTIEQAVDKIGNQLAYAFDTSGAKDNPEQQQAGANQPTAVAETPPTTVAETPQQVTPQTTQPTAQTAAVDTTNPDAVYNYLASLQGQPTTNLATLPTLASATTSDVNPVALPEKATEPASVTLNTNAGPVSRTVDEVLQIYKEVVNPDATIDSPDFQAALNRLSAEQPNVTNNTIVAPTTVVTGNDVPTTTPPDVANAFNIPPNTVKLSDEEAKLYGLAPGLYTINAGGQATPQQVFAPSNNPVAVTPQDMPALRDITNRADEAGTSALVDANANLLPNSFNNATPAQVDAILNAYINNPDSISGVRQDLQTFTQPEITQTDLLDLVTPTPEPTPPATTEPVKPEPVKPEPEKPKPEPTKTDAGGGGGNGTKGGSAAGDQGQSGMVNSGATVAPETVDAAKSVVQQAADSGAVQPADIALTTNNLSVSSTMLGVAPADAVKDNLVSADGTLSAKGVQDVADKNGLTPIEIISILNGSTATSTATGSSIKGSGEGATNGLDAGAKVGEGIGGNSGENVGGKGTGLGTGTGSGTGDGSGDGFGFGDGSGNGSGSGSGTGGKSVKAPAAKPATATPSYSMYSNQNIQAKTPPGAEIDYLYDIGGESIFAPMKKESKYHPREGYYDPYVEKNMAQGGSIDDLYDLLRSK